MPSRPIVTPCTYVLLLSVLSYLCLNKVNPSMLVYCPIHGFPCQSLCCCCSCLWLCIPVTVVALLNDLLWVGCPPAFNFLSPWGYCLKEEKDREKALSLHWPPLEGEVETTKLRRHTVQRGEKMPISHGDSKLL